MISTIKQLRLFLESDKRNYLTDSIRKNFNDRILHRENVVIWKFIRLMRLTDYFETNKNKTPIHFLFYIIFQRIYNKRSIKLGLIIGNGVFKEGVTIYHTGNIVINGYCSIGRNCKLHGSNCIGNSHMTDDVPTIGDNVRFGVGSKAFGKIYIANNITIAAGAVVTKSFYEEGVTLAGIPARIIKKNI